MSNAGLSAARSRANDSVRSLRCPWRLRSPEYPTHPRGVL